jgi:hypothetical protein
MATSYALAANSTLSDDYIYTSDVLLNLETASPLGVFTTAAGSNALFSRADGVLCQLSPSSAGSAAAWSLSEIGNTSSVTEVVAGVQNDGTIHGFYTDADGLHHIELTDSGWSQPAALPMCSGLGLSVSPIGELIVTGVDVNGALLFVRRSGGAWAATSIAVGASLAGNRPVLSLDEACNWVMAIPGIASSGGQIDIYQGSPTQFMAGPMAVPTPTPVARVLLTYRKDNAPGFLFNDTSGALYMNFGNAAKIVATSQIAIAAAAAVLDLEYNIHLFTASPTGVMSVLHQTGWDEGPTWAPIIPLDKGFIALFADVNPLDSDAFFAATTDGALWHYRKDPDSGRWISGRAQTSGGAKSFRVAQYRTEITLTDENGNPAPRVALSVTASVSSNVNVGGLRYPIGPSQSASVTTNAFGKATLSTIAQGINTPKLVVSAPNLAPAAPIAPAAYLHAYLTGQGTLNQGTNSTRPAFDATTLQTATVNGKPLAPRTQDPDKGTARAQAAAAGIASMFQMVAGDGATLPGADGRVGFTLDLSDAGAASFVSYRTLEEFTAGRAKLLGPSDLLGSWWDDIDEFASDVWQGIESGAIQVLKCAAHVAESTIDLVVQIGDEIHTLTQLVVVDIEKAAAVVQGVLAQIGAFVEAVIAWLKMLFDWSDIWNTAQALKAALEGVFPYLDGVIKNQIEPRVDGFFAKETSRVATAFDTVINMYPANTTFGLLNTTALAGHPRFRAAPPIGVLTGPIIGAWLPLVQNNWLFDKLESYLGGSFDTVADLAAPLEKLGAAAKAVLDAFLAVLTDFAQFFQQALSSPKDFVALTVVSFLKAAKAVSIAALTFMDDIVDALLEVARAAIKAVGTILSKDIQVPFISSLIGDVLSPFGISLPSISIAHAFCLAFAIPITLLYKIVHGVGQQPFPGGTLPTGSGSQLPGAAMDDAGAAACQFVGAGLAALWAGLDFGLDAASEAQLMVLKVIEVVAPALVNVFTWPGSIPFTELPLGTPEEIATFCDWVIGWGVVVLDVALLVTSSITWAEGSTMARYQDPVGKVLLSVIGGVDLAAGIVASALGDGNLDEIAVNILGPVPLLTQVLRLKAVEEATEEGSLALKLIIDLIAGVGYAGALASNAGNTVT